jgi:hypothetical protein
VNFYDILSYLNNHFGIKKTNPTLIGPLGAHAPNPNASAARAENFSRCRSLLCPSPLPTLSPLSYLSPLLSLSRTHQEAAWTPRAPPRPTGAQRARPRHRARRRALPPTRTALHRDTQQQPARRASSARCRALRDPSRLPRRPFRLRELMDFTPPFPLLPLTTAVSTSH